MLDFDLSDEQKLQLMTAGKVAVSEFFGEDSSESEKTLKLF